MADVRSGLDPKDYRFLREKPDPGFSPERNKAIIDETIRDTHKFLTGYQRVINNDALNRIDILSSYGRKVFSQHSSKSIKQYLGKEQYEALVGEKIMSKIRIAQANEKLSGRNRFKKGLL
jgi:hypothetical protein